MHKNCQAKQGLKNFSWKKDKFLSKLKKGSSRYHSRKDLRQFSLNICKAFIAKLKKNSETTIES